jgi:hypothetical protein
MSEGERPGGVGPLAGIRVLEVGHMLAGPYATMMLADLGADVTKIEPPGGDISRQVGDTYFASLNRGKRSVRLDLSTEAGQRSLGELAARSHALLVNLKPSGIRRLGLTYEALRSWNERTADRLGRRVQPDAERQRPGGRDDLQRTGLLVRLRREHADVRRVEHADRLVGGERLVVRWRLGVRRPGQPVQHDRRQRKLRRRL